MQAALLFGREDLRIVDVPIPPVGETGVLLRVHACGVCPTDLRKYRTLDGGRLRLPMNLGHEFVGTVVEVGSSVERIRPGQRLMGQGYAGYAEFACLDLAETPCAHVPTPVEIPPTLSDAAATFAEPLADCLHCVEEQVALRPGETVAILGAGTMGQLLTMCVSASGGRAVVSEPVPARREAALGRGAVAVVDPHTQDLTSALRQINRGALADACILTIGEGSLVQAALETVRPRGRVVLFGGFPRPGTVTIDPNLIHYREIQLTGSEWVGAGPYWDAAWFGRALQAMASGRIPAEGLVTATFPLAETAAAFEAAAQPQSFKVIVTCGG